MEVTALQPRYQVAPRQLYTRVTDGWQTVLDHLNVAYVACNAREQIYVSAVASDLIGRTNGGEDLLRHVETLAREAMVSAPFPARGEQGRMAFVSPHAPVWLQLEIVSEDKRNTLAVVMMWPQVTTPSSDSRTLGLTAREDEVARLIASGLPTKHIAGRLGISTHTVRHHTERVFTKLGVGTRAAVAAIVGADQRIGRTSHTLCMVNS